MVKQMVPKKHGGYYTFIIIKSWLIFIRTISQYLQIKQKYETIKHIAFLNIDLVTWHNSGKDR